MTLHDALSPRTPDPALGGMIKLAILAVGGQGGGVLTGWIEAMVRTQGYAAQATSVAGVAQRTGATVYYIEMCPQVPGRQPVFSLMPAAGDVDIMITAEMMEAGRAIIRGFVTPDRTTLITSTHRALAVSEKMVPGDGIADSAEVMAAAEVAARRFIAADFDAVAIGAGSVISATLFGALAASQALPFPREAYEDAIRAGGKGVDGSLRAFAAGFDAALVQTISPSAPTKPAPVAAPQGPARLRDGWARLAARVADLPPAVAELAAPGLRKVVDFQDLAYGEEYLGLVEGILARDTGEFTLTREAAKYIANAMAYDDVIRVADLKTRPARTARIHREMGVKGAQVLALTEFFHPRAEEIVGLLPAARGARAEANPRTMARLDRWFNKGRHIRTDSLTGFMMLYAVASLRRWRRGTHRHAVEVAHRDRWLATALGHLPNAALATEVIRCCRLVKGYSDTHARGLSKFDRVLEGIALVAKRDDAADWARRLREAALKDEEGRALDGALATVRSFV